MPQEPSKKSITIISPINGKGLGRTYLSRPEIEDEANYIELGLVVRDDAGELTNGVEVVITCTPDSTQNKKMFNTGNVTKIFEKSNKIFEVYYYPFRYEIKTPGEHTIKFESEGLTEIIKISAEEDKRPKNEKPKK